MNKELTKKLVEKYPKLYSAISNPSVESFMKFGFECGDGWYGIIDQLSKNIQEYCDSKMDRPQPEAIQVKEKFGSLRCYVGSCDEYIWSLIGKAEEQSSKTCEVCGGKGKIRGRAWVKCLCDKCEIKEWGSS